MFYHEIYRTLSISFCILSFFFNVILTWLVRRRADRVGVYRFITYSLVITDLIYSVAYAITTPLCYSARGVLIVYAISPLSQYTCLMKIFMYVWWTAYVMIMLCTTTCFLYRYGLLCDSRVLSLFTNRYKLLGVLLVFISLLGIWMFNATQVIFAEDLNILRLILARRFNNSDFPVDFEKVYALGVNLEDSNSYQVTLGSLLLLFLMSFCIFAICFSGYSIHYTVVNSIMSDKSRRMHAAALKMIIAQALNPMCFLYIPALVNMTGLITEADLGPFPRIFSCFYGIFPVMNPLIVVYFTEDYKRVILGQSDTGSLNHLTPTNNNPRRSSSRHSTNHQIIHTSVDVTL